MYVWNNFKLKDLKVFEIMEQTVGNELACHCDNRGQLLGS